MIAKQALRIRRKRGTFALSAEAEQRGEAVRRDDVPLWVEWQ